MGLGDSISKLEVLALIPARSGSKSVPGKNLRVLLGKPLLAYSIEHALQCLLITRVVVSTDSQEIAAVAMSYGAEVPFLRPAAIAGDTALDVEFHRHALQWLADNEGYRPDYIVNLRPTHPIRRPATIARAIEMFANATDADSLRSMRPATQTPYKMWRIDKDGYAYPAAPLAGVAEPYNMPRQLLPMVYWQDCYVDITRPEVILEKNSTSGQRIFPFVVEEECVDIDDEDDFIAAERALKSNSAAAGRPPLARYPS